MSNSILNIVNKLEAKNVIIYDDNHNSFNQFAQDTLDNLTGKVRCFLPATIFSDLLPTHILVLVPPYYEELEFAINSTENKKNYHCWIEYKNKFMDLSKLIQSNSRNEYDKFVDIYQQIEIKYLHMNNDDSYSLMTKRFIKQIQSPSLVIPFETRKWHHETYENEIKNNLIKLFSPVDQFVDKVNAAKLIVKSDSNLYKNYTNPVKIDLYLDDNALLTDKNGCNILATRIINECINMENKDKKAYIKLDSKGSDGIDNISYSQYNNIYNGTIKDRINTLRDLLINRFSNYKYFPCQPMVENNIETSTDNLGVQEYIVSGIFDDNKWHLWSITRAIVNDKGRYLGVIGTSVPQKLGILEKDIDTMINIVEKSAFAMQKHGYVLGYISKDFMYDRLDSNFKIHDHNDRRGGRSFIEQLIRLYPNKLFIDKVIEVNFNKNINRKEFIRRAYNKVFKEKQFYCIYGTSSLYNATNQKKFKIYVAASIPSNIIENGNIFNYIQDIENYTKSLYEGSKYA